MATKVCSKHYREANKDKISEYKKQYCETNKDKMLEYQKHYREANKDKIAEYQKHYREANKDKMLEYREANKNKMLECRKQYYEANKEKIIEHQKQYYAANKDKISEHSKQYYATNKDKMLEYNKQYLKTRRKTDPQYRIMNNLRSRLNKAFNGLSKSQSTKQLLGIDIELFSNWIRFQIPDGYSANDVGPKLQLDHVLPLSSFNLQDPNEQKKACNWINITPITAQMNIKKRDRVDNFLYHKQLVKAQFFEQNVLNFELN